MKTIKEQAEASIYRWCVHLMRTNDWGAVVCRIVVGFVSLLFLLLFIATFPVTLPLVAWLNRRAVRATMRRMNEQAA